MKAKSIKGKSTAEIKVALEEIRADGFEPTLAICFISKSQDRQAINELLDKEGITIFGCTTNGEFIDENPEKASAAILLLDINKNHFQIYFEEFQENKYRQVAKSIAQNAKSHFSVPAFIIGISNAAADGEEVLR